MSEFPGKAIDIYPDAECKGFAVCDGCGQVLHHDEMDHDMMEAENLRALLLRVLAVHCDWYAPGSPEDQLRREIREAVGDE